MGLYGAQEILFRRFGGGLVRDQDPTEIGDDQASDAQNVDFEDETLTKRLGRVAYNGTAPTANKVRGLYRYYGRSGANGIFLMQANTAIYEDDGAGSFSSVVTGLTGGAPMDFLGWKERVYAGNGVDAVQRRKPAPSWAAVTLLSAPATPTVALSSTLLETFDSNTAGGAWTVSGSALAATNNATLMREGTNCMKLTASGSGAVGSSVSRVWSSGATVDLSKGLFLSLWVYSEKVGMVYQVGVKDNSGTLDFSLFPTFTAREKETWVRIRVPLDRIPPASRTASTGLGIKFVEKGSGNSYSLALYFDEARLEGPLVPDHYSYYATYAETESSHGQDVIVRESNPSVAAEIDMPADDAALGVTVNVAGDADTTNITRVLVYRSRKDGEFARPRLVQTLTNTGAGTLTFVDTLGEDQIAIDNAPELVSAKIAPPIAKTYAVANSRLVAGHAYIDTDANGSADTWYPWRLYLSRLGYPEEFGGDREPTDPNAPGWLDISSRDHIRRLVEFDGQLLVFCDRAIYTLEGSGWADYTFYKRADVGLDAREAVAVYDRLILFLAADGVRVLAPNRSQPGLFETWVVSEPVDSVLRRIPLAYRPNVAFGLDERARLHVSYTPSGGTANSEALVFDLTARGALQPGFDSMRRGWTQYTNWGFSCFCTLKRGGGDAGQLVGGDPATGKVHYLHRSTADAALLTDDGSAIAWYWQGKAQDAGPGSTFEWVFVGADFDAAASQTVTATPILDGAASGTTFSLALGSASSGYVSKLARCGAAIRGRFGGLKLSGSQSVALKCRSARLGVYTR